MILLPTVAICIKKLPDLAELYWSVRYIKIPGNQSCSFVSFKVVIDASKKYLPFMSKGFESPKLTVHVGDGAEYMKKRKSEYDVIITDSPDPKGKLSVKVTMQKEFFT